MFAAPAQVLADAALEQDGLLLHYADFFAQRLARIAFHVLPVDPHAAGNRVVKARDQADQRRLAAAGAADDADRLPALHGEADVAKARRAGALVGEGDVLKAHGVLALRCRRGALGRVLHARAHPQHAADALRAGHRLVERDDQRRELDQLDDDLQHVVVQRDDLPLLHAAEVDLHGRLVDQEHGREVDEHIGQRIQQRGDPADKLVQLRQRAVARLKLLDRLRLAAERADHAHAGQVLARQAGHAVQPGLRLLEQRDADQHDEKRDGQQHRDRHRKDDGAAGVDRERHDHRTQNDERAAQQQAQAHVEAVLHLVHVVGQPRDQRVAADRVQLRERERLDVVEHRLPQRGRKADARLRGEELRGEAAPHADRGHQQQDQKADDDVRTVVVRDADVDHLRDNDRHEQIEHDLEELEKRREHAFLPVRSQINGKISHDSDSILFS